MLIIGLTGGIGSGKSTIANFLKNLGAKVIEADEIAKEVTAKDSPAYRKIVAHFGAEILAPDGQINRPKLAKIIFSNPSQLKALNEIIHPQVKRVIKNRLESLKKEALKEEVVVVEVPLLIEAGMMGMVDKVAVVVSTPEIRFERLSQKGLSEKDALERMRSQISDKERLRHADFVILNKGSFATLQEEIENFFKQLKELAVKSDA